MDSKENRDLIRKLDEILGADGTEALLNLIDLRIVQLCPQRSHKKPILRVANYWLFIWLTLLLSLLSVILYVV